MGHWRSLLDSEVLRFVDLQRDYAVQIATVKKGKVKGAGGKESGKALLTFTGWPKPAAFGTAQLTTIAGLYGNDVKDWQGDRNEPVVAALKSAVVTLEQLAGRA